MLPCVKNARTSKLPRNPYAERKKNSRNTHPRARRLDTAVGAVLLVASVGHAAEFVLAGELAAELTVRGHKLLADVDHDLARGDGTVGLDPDHDFRNVRMSHCVHSLVWRTLVILIRQYRVEITFVAGHDDVRRLLEMLAEKIAESVVLLQQNEVRGVGHAYPSVSIRTTQIGKERGREIRTSERLLGDLLLASALIEEEELETTIRVSISIQNYQGSN